MIEPARIYQSLQNQQKEQFELLSSLLIRENQRCNLTRITDPEQIMRKHFFDSLAAEPLLTEYAENCDHSPFFIDIGSGAGLPVLALAIAEPDWNFVSVEATGKKADFQMLAAEELGLTNVEIIQDRAEELAREQDYRRRFDFASARALGRLEIVIELAGAFIRKGGRFLAWKGPRVVEELPAGKKAAKIMGLSGFKEFAYKLSENEQSGYRLIEAVKTAETPSRYPREFKYIKKDPLGS